MYENDTTMNHSKTKLFENSPQRYCSRDCRSRSCNRSSTRYFLENHFESLELFLVALNLCSVGSVVAVGQLFRPL